MRHHYRHTRMAQTGKRDHSKCPQRCGRTGILTRCCWGVNVYPLWETIWQFLKKLSIHLPQDPAIALLGFPPREMKARGHTENSPETFIVALSVIAKREKVEAIPCPTQVSRSPSCTSLQWSNTQL